MFLPSLVHSTAHSLCATIALQVAVEQFFKYEGPVADL